MTYRRLLMAAAMSSLLLAGPLASARGEESGDSGGSLPFCCCAYAMWTCTYNDGSWWGGCDPNWEPMQLFTWIARERCTVFHAGN